MFLHTVKESWKTEWISAKTGQEFGYTNNTVTISLVCCVTLTDSNFIQCGKLHRVTIAVQKVNTMCKSIVHF